MKTGSQILESIAKKVACDAPVATYVSLTVDDRDKLSPQLSYHRFVNGVDFGMRVESHLPQALDSDGKIKYPLWENENGVLLDQKRFSFEYRKLRNIGIGTRTSNADTALALDKIIPDLGLGSELRKKTGTDAPHQLILLQRYGLDGNENTFIVGRGIMEKFFYDTERNFMKGNHPLIEYSISTYLNFNFVFPRVTSFGQQRFSNIKMPFELGLHSEGVSNQDFTNDMLKMRSTLGNLSNTTSAILDHEQDINELLKHFEKLMKEE